MLRSNLPKSVVCILCFMFSLWSLAVCISYSVTKRKTEYNLYTFLLHIK